MSRVSGSVDKEDPLIIDAIVLDGDTAGTAASLTEASVAEGCEAGKGCTGPDSS